MGSLIGGSALLLLSIFMLFGFMGAEIDAPAAARYAAFGIAVVLPAGVGIGLIRAHFRGQGKLADRKEELRQQTIEAELLRLAGTHGGKLTIVEAVAALAITPESAKTALDALALRGIAEYEVTDSGIIVYRFRDLQRIAEKTQSKGLLE